MNYINQLFKNQKDLKDQHQPIKGDSPQKKLDLADQNDQKVLASSNQNKSIKEEIMDDMDQRHQYREFKMKNKAAQHLNRSITSRNQVLLNEIQNKKEDQNVNFVGDSILQQYYQEQINYQVPLQDKKNKFYKQKVVFNIGEENQQDFQENVAQKIETNEEIRQKDVDKSRFTPDQENFFNNLKKTQTIKDQKYASENDIQQLQSTINQKNQKLQQSQVNKQKEQVESTKFIRMKTSQFNCESEVFKNSLKQQSLFQFNKQETIQNGYLDSIFISEDDEDMDDDNNDNEYENDQNIIEEEQETQSNKETFDIQEQLQKPPFNEEDETQVQQALENIKIQKNKKQKVKKLIRKKYELTAVPDEMNSFYITLQRGKKKKQKNFNNEILSIQFIPQSQTLLKDHVGDFQIRNESKSNLNNLIPSKNKENLSFVLNCSNVFNFSKMTSVLLNFQYKKQDALLYHQQNDFRYITSIGEGSFGTVDLYEFTPLKFPIAVKKLKTIEEFARELYLMETLQSIYMPQLFFYDETQKKLFMEMGLCSLEDLKKYSEQTDFCLTDQQTFSILNQLLVAIELFIDQKAFHSDIKPSNIVIRSKLNESNKIQLQLMIIDYGGASFDIEDYWIYYTPAFVCPKLWEKLLSSDSCFSKDISKEKSAYIQELDSIEENYEQECDTNNIEKSKLENSVINKIKIKPIKQTNLGEIDRRQSMENSLTLKTNNSNDKSTLASKTSQNFPSYQQQDSIQMLTDQKQPISRVFNDNLSSYQKSQNFDKKSKIFQFQETYSKQLSMNEGNKDFSQILKIQNQEQSQLKSQQINYDDIQITQNLKLERNNEKIANEITLTWEEVRYSEMYAGCRCIQYLILNKNEEDLFKKKNIDEFFMRYHKQYPKTLKLMYKIMKKNKFCSLNKSQLNQLFTKTTEQDFKIDIDPNILFEISPLKKQWNQILKTQI
ncbi:kinase domain protein (macronuclear) [Tetrahymena thermophila SB210]|uniref:Kinase domain protein n=1 Tax=Tetrahymena thermophila (strain SB210) TaxID=312017 RepID=I7LZJ6_TETTS|nr:kinase domain protein [Tetrahymena thermophila SB210]EAR84055.2 kinase domain protein [Tetrahymena thermophila SB210]|eukprot:XP_001031718.2 kinase domain protein [Tetrahymena thermophila SB210]